MYDLVFDAKLGIIARTLYRAMPDLLHYSFLALALVVGITMSSHLTLGTWLPAFATVSESFSNWAITLLLHVPPVASTDASGVVLNFAEAITVIVFSIVIPFMLFVFIGFVLTIIHQFLVQEWIFAYFGSRLAVWDAVKHIALELWYVHRHSGGDDAALVAFLALAAGRELTKHELTDMEKINANMENSDDLTLDDIREVLRLMQQEGFFELLKKSSTPPLQEGQADCVLHAILSG
ncbi:MAG: hypothetical protein HETSPECPRED_006352 [Heterodermia speciosa]|uniref:Uncharacterized protein n=1 Tax=Heterodermia speciosa TaxID=116794 RepID=A0A8H3FL01_9LECA|nr:MAG: hypothetical protein HETSPECPRED_006352 [Heterodermia speciosa]